MNTASYLKELGFVLSASCDWQTRFRLLFSTVRFHGRNFLSVSPRSQRPLNLNIRIGGRKRHVTVRLDTGDLFIFYEVLAFEAYHVDSRIVNPNEVRVIVDCGGNIGLTALYFSSHYPNARILSIEPDPSNFAVLQENTRQEPRIVPVQAAIVGRSGQTIFLSQDRPSWGNHVQTGIRPSDSIEVIGKTIPELCLEHGINRIDILKVDIEGGEAEVFKSPSFLNMTEFILIELHPPYSDEQFKRDISPYKFRSKLPGQQGGARAMTASRSY